MRFVLLILVFISLSGYEACSEVPPEKPNIILVMADDLGWGDTGYNGNMIIKTPHLDKMANEGIQFNRFYSASAVCSPTRASVLTGRNPYRTGVFTANNGILRTEEITIPELLREQGYATGHFGKWHLGTLTHTEKDANRGRSGNTKEYNPPVWHGYDKAFVTESKVPTWDPMKKPIKQNLKVGWDYINDGEEYKPYGTHYWNIEGEKVTNNLEGDDSRVIMDRVLPFIAKSQEENKPFFAVVWFHTPHKPCVAGPKYAAMYSGLDPEMQNYAGCITAMDEQIGRLRQYLQDMGVANNTMVWFCSDNGPERNTPGVTGGFRASKRSLYEGGVRIPGILVWPAKIEKPFQTNIPAVTSDYLPTIAASLGIENTKLKNKLDGVNLLPLIEGKTTEREMPVGFLYNNQASFITNEFKLIIQKDKTELYHVVNDPYERNPLNNNKLSKDLRNKLDNFVQSCNKSFMGNEYGTTSFDKLNQIWPETNQKNSLN